MSNILHKIKLEREKQLSEEKKILSKPSLIKALKTRPCRSAVSASRPALCCSSRLKSRSAR